MNDNESSRQERDAQQQQRWANIGKRLLVEELQTTANEPFDAMHAAAKSIHEGDLDEADFQACQIALFEAIGAVNLLGEVFESEETVEIAPYLFTSRLIYKP